MKLHYKIAGDYRPDAHLIGSNTIKTGLDLYGKASPEKDNDFRKPDRDNKLPYWLIIDSKGKLKDMLHEVRRFEFCRDVILMISKETPKDYIDYLKVRDYDFHIYGKKQVDIKNSLDNINKKYNIKSILTDSGKILGNHLIRLGVIKEISLLIHPIIVGNRSYNIFDSIDNNIKLIIKKNILLESNYIWLVYKI
jgi:2,5-diamino-6-(ribosylamino)-4(3H)-pyrimidinone 5'-phosphate reductase